MGFLPINDYRIKFQPKEERNYMQLPNFIIGGALKCGTTSLFYQLDQHPEVFMCEPKEPRYFLYEIAQAEQSDKRALNFPARTLEEYAALFEGSAGFKAIGEASAHYFNWPAIAPKIKDTLPDVKIIFMLRNPIDRAYSHYLHAVRIGAENRPVEEGLAVTESRISLGCYAEKLETWFATIDSKQTKIIIFDDFVKNGLHVFADVCRFLDIDDSFTPDLSVQNKGGRVKNQRLDLFLEKVKSHPLRKTINPLVPKSIRAAFKDMRQRNMEKAPPLPPAIVLQLSDYYKDDIKRLETLIDRDLSAWLDGAFVPNPSG